MTTRPLLAAAAAEDAAGTGFDPLALIEILASLLPLLQLCAGADVAGWLAGGGAWFNQKRAARRRQRLVLDHLLAKGVPEMAAARTLERLRVVPPLTMIQAYREAGL